MIGRSACGLDPLQILSQDIPHIGTTQTAVMSKRPVRGSWTNTWMQNLKTTWLLRRPVVLLNSLRPNKNSLFQIFGVHFGSLFGPSWPRCSQRATQNNTNTTEQPTAKKKLTFFEIMASILDPFSTLLGQGAHKEQPNKTNVKKKMSFGRSHFC